MQVLHKINVSGSKYFYGKDSDRDGNYQPNFQHNDCSNGDTDILNQIEIYCQHIHPVKLVSG